MKELRVCLGIPQSRTESSGGGGKRSARRFETPILESNTPPRRRLQRPAVIVSSANAGT